MSKMEILKNYEGAGRRHGGAERITPEGKSLKFNSGLFKPNPR